MYKIIDQYVAKYDVIIIGGKEKLIKPINNNDDGTVLYRLKVYELFSVLYFTHTAVGHGGRNRMLAKIKQKYCNVTKKSIMIFF